MNIISPLWNEERRVFVAVETFSPSSDGLFSPRIYRSTERFSDDMAIMH
ncbi:hypothetical protein EPIR_0033 [Erwinia piriflorinigrans CFBP 5888]|uniref:Uncharacterized protein n=1 Tax=Erwinia piriflorinigrans CFBP 5888 TaxID=1161919 RepID=V5Z367_9GAMM|nr:hypothetical protein EPIR_0033 [Erwinia piriflorinigrans CFBP 5888]